MGPEQQDLEWGQIVARAWRDEAFKRRLLTDPAAVLRECGVPVPPGSKVKVIEDTAETIHLTLPRRPNAEEIAEEDLARVTGGLGTQDGDPCAGGKLRAR